jgi:thiamine biosynthesis lipoprotein
MTVRNHAAGIRCVWALVLSVPGLTACWSPHDTVNYEQFFAFGTLVEITIYGVDNERASRVSDVIENDFRTMHADWHAWQPGALAETNKALATGRPFSAPQSVLPLIRLAQELSASSNGLFNPAIGRLIALWGFHDDDAAGHSPPEAKQVRELLAQRPEMDDIKVEGATVVCRNPAVQLDFGAFAKGYGIDVAIGRLRELGVENAIINAGGDLRAIGRHGKRPWRIGIRHPRKPGIIASVEVAGDESVFTSGDYERYYEYGGKRYHHIINPRTGSPATGTISVTVIHSNAATADAAATALFIAGPDEWHQIARMMGIKLVMLVDDKNVIHMNPAMARRVTIEAGEGFVTDIGEPLT